MKSILIFLAMLAACFQSSAQLTPSPNLSKWEKAKEVLKEYSVEIEIASTLGSFFLNEMESDKNDKYHKEIIDQFQIVNEKLNNILNKLDNLDNTLNQRIATQLYLKDVRHLLSQVKTYYDLYQKKKVVDCNFLSDLNTSVNDVLQIDQTFFQSVGAALVVQNELFHKKYRTCQSPGKQEITEILGKYKKYFIGVRDSLVINYDKYKKQNEQYVIRLFNNEDNIGEKKINWRVRQSKYNAISGKYVIYCSEYQSQISKDTFGFYLLNNFVSDTTLQTSNCFNTSVDSIYFNDFIDKSNPIDQMTYAGSSLKDGYNKFYVYLTTLIKHSDLNYNDYNENFIKVLNNKNLEILGTIESYKTFIYQANAFIKICDDLISKY